MEAEKEFLNLTLYVIINLDDHWLFCLSHTSKWAKNESNKKIIITDKFFVICISFMFNHLKETITKDSIKDHLRILIFISKNRTFLPLQIIIFLFFLSFFTQTRLLFELFFPMNLSSYQLASYKQSILLYPSYTH